jgi:hypothetical protein
MSMPILQAVLADNGTQKHVNFMVGDINFAKTLVHPFQLPLSCCRLVHNLSYVSRRIHLLIFINMTWVFLQKHRKALPKSSIRHSMRSISFATTNRILLLVNSSMLFRSLVKLKRRRLVRRLIQFASFDCVSCFVVRFC